MSTNADEIAEEEIVERIFEAVVEQRLPPGTKLSESALCEAFGVGRMRIRRSLLLLASREVVELRANRGAYVASPTADQAREVFDVTGAGDTVIATLATLVAAGLTLREAMPLANKAGGVVVGKFGTATVSFEELMA